MKFKNIGIIVLILGFLFAIAYFVRTNSKAAIQCDTTTAFTSSIQKTSVVTGTVIPEDEVEIKPQLNGIISEIMVEEGDMVNNGDLIAIIKVVPDERSVYGAQSHGSAATGTARSAVGGPFQTFLAEHRARATGVSL